MRSLRKAKPTSWVDNTNGNEISNTCKYHHVPYFPKERLALSAEFVNKERLTSWIWEFKIIVA